VKPISLREAYAGKTLLITGTTGFLAKVWFALLLEKLPEIRKIVVLLRPKRRQDARIRFEKYINESPVFRGFHERYGAEGLVELIGPKVEVIDGDITKPDLGIAPEIAGRLRRELDLLVNCAGLVDFSPDIRSAFSTNVGGATGAYDFVASCEKAGLVHVSTSYVAGSGRGRIPEELPGSKSPNGLALDPEKELASVEAAVARILREQTKLAPSNGNSGAHRRHQKDIAAAMAEEGTRRALHYGFPNTYTYSKSVAERLLVARMKRSEKAPRIALFRPAIVESAIEFPFPGWNEGFNTSGPLSYLLGTWVRHIPGHRGNPFDLIPIDEVCKSLTAVGAAVMLGRHAPVYHCGSSDKNMLPIDRACDLVALAHRKHLRKNGRSALERIVLSRWDSLTTGNEFFLKPKVYREAGQSISKALKSAADKSPGFLRSSLISAAYASDKTWRGIKQIERCFELFRPFLHDNHHVFACEAIDRIPVLESELQFAPEQIDWRSYWLDIHLPGLREWCFPQLEGGRIPKNKPAVRFQLPERPRLESEESAAPTCVMREAS